MAMMVVLTSAFRLASLMTCEMLTGQSLVHPKSERVTFLIEIEYDSAFP